MAMVDYPYETNFVNPLPAWPVKVACERATELDPRNDSNYLIALQKAASTFYNYEGQMKCLNQTASDSSGLDASGWNVMACNEMVMPMGSTGVSDMFPQAYWNESSYTKMCQETYGLTP